MKNAKQVCQCFLGILGILGMTMLTSCESNTDDIATLLVVNQTGVPLSIFVDGSDTPELTVPAHTTWPLVFDAGTHQVRWQGGAIQGQVEVTVPQNESKTLTIWGSGNAYLFK